MSLPVMQLKCGTSGNAVPTMLLKCGTQANAVPTLLRKCEAPPNPCVYDTILATWSQPMCTDMFPPYYWELRNLQVYTPPVALPYGIDVWNQCFWSGIVGTVDFWNYENNSWLFQDVPIKLSVLDVLAEHQNWLIEVSLVLSSPYNSKLWQKTIAASSPFGTHTKTYVCKDYGQLAGSGTVTLEAP